MHLCIIFHTHTHTLSRAHTHTHAQWHNNKERERVERKTKLRTCIADAIVTNNVDFEKVNTNKTFEAVKNWNLTSPMTGPHKVLKKKKKLSSMLGSVGFQSKVKQWQQKTTFVTLRSKIPPPPFPNCVPSDSVSQSATVSIYAHFVVLGLVTMNSKSAHLIWLPRDLRHRRYEIHKDSINFEPALWSWPRKQQSNFYTKHSSLWWCTIQLNVVAEK